MNFIKELIYQLKFRMCTKSSQQQAYEQFIY